MKSPLGQRVGQALTWKAAQLAGTKLIFLARTVVLARLLSPDDFGLLAIATVGVGVLMSVTELGMVPALVHQPEVDDRHYDGAWTVNLLRALCVSAVLLAAAPFVAGLFGEPRAAGLLRLLALKPVLDAVASAKVAALTRRLEYRRLALLSLSAAAVETLVAIALASGLGVWALAAGALAGSATGVAASYALAPHRPRVRLAGDAVRPLVLYGRWVFLTGLVAVGASALTQLVISRRLGAAELGLYFLAAKLAFLPHEVASQVVGDVAFPLYARLQADGARVARAFRSLLRGTAAVLVPTYVLIIALAPRLEEHVLGAQWEGSAPLIQLLSLVGIVGLFGDASGPLFRGLGHPKWILHIEALQSALVVALLWALTARFGVFGAALSWVLGVAGSQVLSLVLARRVVDRPLAGSLRPVASVASASLAGAAIAVGSGPLVHGIGGVIATASLAAGAVVGALWLCDQRFEIGLRHDLAQAFPQVAGLASRMTTTS